MWNRLFSRKRLRDRELDQWHGGDGEKWRRLRNSRREWQRFSVHHIVCAFFFFFFLPARVCVAECDSAFLLWLSRAAAASSTARPQGQARKQHTHTHTHTHTTVFLDNLLDLSHSLSRSITSQFWHFLTLLYPHPSLAASKADITVKRTITCQRCYPPRDERQLFYFGSGAAPVRQPPA